MKATTKYIKYLVIFMLISGCASTLKQHKSGFLGDYSALQDSAEYENAQVYVAPLFGQQQLAQITAIKLVPFEVWIETENSAGETVINADLLAKLHVYFHSTLKKALTAKNYRLVEESGPGVLTIRGAFADIKFTEPDMSAADLIPIKLVINASKSAYLSATDQRDVLSQVAIEVEFLMGDKDTRVFAMTVSRALEASVSQGTEGNYQAAVQIFDIWIENFINKLEKVKAN